MRARLALRPGEFPAADIQHFMREQAANTRGATLPRLTARMPRRHATRMRLATRRQEQVLPATGGVHTALQRRHNTIAAWRVDRSRAGTAKSKAFAAPNEAEFTVQETVPNDQVVQAELSFGPADSADQNARQVVAQAFADIDREGAGSLTASDLLAANDRARDDRIDLLGCKGYGPRSNAQSPALAQASLRGNCGNTGLKVRLTRVLKPTSHAAQPVCYSVVRDFYRDNSEVPKWVC